VGAGSPEPGDHTDSAGGDAGWISKRTATGTWKSSHAPLREEVVVVAQDDLAEPAPLDLSYQIGPAGEVVVDLGGELDILSAEA
jgi:hypothetical protein